MEHNHDIYTQTHRLMIYIYTHTGLTYSRRCETGPGCPLRSAGMPGHTNTPEYPLTHTHNPRGLWHGRVLGLGSSHVIVIISHVMIIIFLTIFPPVALMCCLSASQCLSWASAAYWEHITRTLHTLCMYYVCMYHWTINYLNFTALTTIAIRNY